MNIHPQIYINPAILAEHTYKQCKMLLEIDQQNKVSILKIIKRKADLQKAEENLQSLLN